MTRTLERNRGTERLVFLHAWNEWCEGSYLEPDTEYGLLYLEAIRNALGSPIGSMPRFAMHGAPSGHGIQVAGDDE